MPGRYDILRQYNVAGIGKFAPFEFDAQVYVPGQQVPAIVMPNQRRILTGMHWGFGDIYNARVETVRVKPLWRTSYLNHRMIFPLTAFFEREWFTSAEPMAAAGIFRRLYIDGKQTYEASMLTQPANDFIARHHPRMPVFIPISEVDSWLTQAKDIEAFSADQELEYTS